MLPLSFWYLWQYPYLSWIGLLGLLFCLLAGGHSYRLSVQADYRETTKHLKKDGTFRKVANLFSSKLLSTIFIWLFFLAPNFITFWMFLEKTDIIFWLFYILLPFAFIIFKSTPSFHDSDKMIRTSSAFLSAILALPIALLEALIGGSSKVEVLEGGNDVLKFWSWCSGYISDLKYNILNKIFELFPWAEFWITFFSSSLEYFGVFFILCLMFHSPRKHFDHEESILQTSKALFKDKNARRSLSIFSLILIIAVVTKINISLSEETQQKYIEKAKQTSLGKEVVKVQKVAEIGEKTMRKLKEKGKCGWFANFFFDEFFNCEMRREIFDSDR